MAGWTTGMSWDDLVSQANADYDRAFAWRGEDPTMPMTSINGRPAQIYNGTGGGRGANNATQFIIDNDPDAPPGYITALSRGEDGSIQKRHTPRKQGFPVGAAMVLAAPFAASAMLGEGLGAAGLAEAGAGGLSEAAIADAAVASGGGLTAAGEIAGAGAAAGAAPAALTTGGSMAGLPTLADVANVAKIAGPAISTITGAAAANSANSAAKDATAAQNRAIDQQQPLINEQVLNSQTARQWGIEDRNRWKEWFMPLENGMITEAQNYDSPQRYAEEAGRAQGNVMQQYSMAADRLSRTPGLQSASAATRLALASAAAGANAQTDARRQVRDGAWARKVDALSLGKNLPATATTALNSSTSGLGNATSALGNQANAYGNIASANYQRAGQTAASVGGMVGDVTRNFIKNYGPTAATSSAGLDPTYGVPNARAYDFSDNMQEYGI